MRARLGAVSVIVFGVEVCSMFLVLVSFKLG